MEYLKCTLRQSYPRFPAYTHVSLWIVLARVKHITLEIKGFLVVDV
jgi:hypothetical protein